MTQNSWPVETPQTDRYITYLKEKWPSYFFYDKSSSGHLTLFQPGGGGGGIHPPPGFSLAIATKINRSTPKSLTFNFYYRDIIWPKIKFITCQGVTWSLFCRKHFVSQHIFHCIFTEFSCSTFSFFWHLYLVLISVFWWKTYFWLSFYESIEI